MFYPLAGHYLSAHSEEAGRILRVCLPAAAVILALSVALVAGLSEKRDAMEAFFGPVWLYAITVFLLVSRHPFTSSHSVLKEAGSCVFGIYLIEDIVRNRLEFLVPVLGSMIGALPAALVYVLLVFLVSAVIVWIGRKIPGLRFLLHS